MRGASHRPKLTSAQFFDAKMALWYQAQHCLRMARVTQLPTSRYRWALDVMRYADAWRALGGWRWIKPARDDMLSVYEIEASAIIKRYEQGEQRPL